MPNLNFKSQFAPAVESGEKRQSIQPKRKIPIKPGDTLHLYTGMRTKQCRKLGRATCTKTRPIHIRTGRVILDGQNLTLFQIMRLAENDGFEKWKDFFGFFRKQYGLPFEGDLIQWEPENEGHHGRLTR
jgi:hypothetical protein